MNKSLISIVIVNYNVKDLVLKCLQTLYDFNAKELNLEVFVVDNHSSDGSVEAIQSQFPQVRLIANSNNMGFPAANNQAFEMACGEYIFMLNPDTEFIDDSLVKLVRHMDRSPEIAIIAPRLLNTDRSPQSSVWRFPTIQSIFGEMYYLPFMVKSKNYADKNLMHTFEAESFSGAAILFRSTLLKEIGLLDETMFWIEDIEFCYRALQKGHKALYYPEAKLVHHVGQSAKKNYRISLSNQIFNKIKFFRKHHSGMQSFTVSLISFIHVIMKCMVFGVLAPFKVVYRRKAIAYFYTLPKVFNPPKGIK